MQHQTVARTNEERYSEAADSHTATSVLVHIDTGTLKSKNEKSKNENKYCAWLGSCSCGALQHDSKALIMTTHVSTDTIVQWTPKPRILRVQHVLLFFLIVNRFTSARQRGKAAHWVGPFIETKRYDVWRRHQRKWAFPGCSMYEKTRVLMSKGKIRIDYVCHIYLRVVDVLTNMCL